MLRRRRHGVALAVLASIGILVAPARARAQVCRASLPFEQYRVQIGGDGGWLRGSTLNNGSTGQVIAAVGGHDLFGRVGAGRNNYSDYGFGATVIDVDVGTQIHLGGRRAIVACPEADLEVESTSSLGAGAPVGSHTRSGGGSVRVGAQGHRGALQASAFVGAGWLRSRQTVSGDALLSGPQVSIADAGFVELGAGFQPFRRLIITSSVRLPVGVSHGIRAVVVSAIVGF